MRRTVRRELVCGGTHHANSAIGCQSRNQSLASLEFRRLFRNHTLIFAWASVRRNDEEKMYDYSKPTGFTHETGHVSPARSALLFRARLENVTAILPFCCGAARFRNRNLDADTKVAAAQFTQTVWKGTKQLGCAFARCDGIIGKGVGVGFIFQLCRMQAEEWFLTFLFLSILYRPSLSAR